MPKFVKDIFLGHKKRINLSYVDDRRGFRFPKFAKHAFVAVFVGYLIFGGYVLAPISPSGTFAQADSEDERAELEAELEAVLKELEQVKAQRDVLTRQGNTLQSEVNRLNAQISKINLQIKAINLSIQKLAGEIENTQGRIEVAEEDITLRKNSLADLLQDLYEYDTASLAEILLASPSLSDFFGGVNDLMLVQDNLRVAIAEIVALRDELLQQKETLSIQKEDTEKLKAFQDAQRREVQSVRGEKDNLLQVTRGEEARYQTLVLEKQKTAAEIRQQIFRLLGVDEALTFEEAYSFAKLAEQSTGIRAAFIMAILKKESDFGANVGQCTLADTHSGATLGVNTGRRFENGIKPSRDLQPFLRITRDLSLDPMQRPVSCPIASAGGYGGAMGPAQFIPSTWVLYEDKISNITGNNPPSPWRNADAFAATAVYIRDLYNDSVCTSYAKSLAGRWPERELREECAAARYYAGGGWRTHYQFYGVAVREQADGFQQDINIMTGSITQR
ncbi:MAG: lytic murein transglycosylase [Candidatus Colwellbacteria bacterium]|nr:lytic murein transglycosylase [Candidatus Colwellbacteria bacterium]